MNKTKIEELSGCGFFVPLYFCNLTEMLKPNDIIVLYQLINFDRVGWNCSVRNLKEYTHLSNNGILPSLNRLRKLGIIEEYKVNYDNLEVVLNECNERRSKNTTPVLKKEHERSQMGTEVFSNEYSERSQMRTHKYKDNIKEKQKEMHSYAGADCFDLDEIFGDFDPYTLHTENK